MKQTNKAKQMKLHIEISYAKEIIAVLPEVKEGKTAKPTGAIAFKAMVPLPDKQPLTLLGYKQAAIACGSKLANKLAIAHYGLAKKEGEKHDAYMARLKEGALERKPIALPDTFFADVLKEAKALSLTWIDKEPNAPKQSVSDIKTNALVESAKTLMANGLTWDMIKSGYPTLTEEDVSPAADVEEMEGVEE